MDTDSVCHNDWWSMVLDEMTSQTPRHPTPTGPLTPESLVPRLGDALVERKLITPGQLEDALQRQGELRQGGRKVLLGRILVEMGAINQETLDRIVTEQILQLRNALEDSNRQLEIRVQLRTQELRSALDRLSELTRLKSNFIANISHELRTPLTHLTGYVDLLSTQDLGPLTPDQAQAVQVMQKAAERLDHLIQDLIQFSLVERGDIQAVLQPVNFLQACSHPVEAAHQKATAKGILFTSMLPEEEIIVLADEEKIEWVISQLLDNAIKFTPPGGMVQLTCRADDTFLHISVSDTGIGIPPGKLEEVFEPFHQLDGASTRRYGGTGLGLTLAKKIVEAHQGSISIESEPGKGSTFSFSLTIIQNTI